MSQPQHTLSSHLG